MADATNEDKEGDWEDWVAYEALWSVMSPDLGDAENAALCAIDWLDRITTAHSDIVAWNRETATINKMERGR